MTIKRINEFPEGSGSLTSDDIFLFMDDPSSGGVTKKISLSQITVAISGNLGSGGGSSITVANSGDNRILTSTGSSTGINAESNLTFDGSGLSVNGTAQFNQVFPTVSNVGSVNGTINTNVSLAQIFDITLTGNATLANPTNPVNGVTIRWRIRQDNSGNRSVTLGNKFVIPSTATNPLPFSTGSGVMDILAATYHAGRDKWDVIAFVPGY